MARILDLVAVFRLLSRTTTARTAFRTGTLPGYLALMLFIRLGANLADALRVIGAHSGADASPFFLASFMIFAVPGILVLPLLGARTSALLLCHPRLATVPRLTFSFAEAIASVTSIPTLILAATAFIQACLIGKGIEGPGAFALLLAGVIITALIAPAMIHHLNIDPRETELLLILPLAALIGINPHLKFSDNILHLEPVSLPLYPIRTHYNLNQPGAGPAFPQLVTAILTLILILILELVFLGALTRIHESARNKLKLNPFLSVIASRIKAGTLIITGLIIYYVLNIPIARNLATGICAFFSLIAGAGILDAIISTRQDCMRLFGRKPGPGMHGLPSALAAAALAAPYLAAFTARLLEAG